MSYLLYSRIAGRKILSINNADLFKRLYAAKKKDGTRQVPSGCIQHIYQRPYETHDDKNRRLKRPLCPCLSIYAIQVCSVCSITHRITGVVGSAYLFFLASYSLLASHDFSYACQYVQCMHLPSILLSLFKFGIAFPYIYHSMNGLRHLTWDTGRMLDIKTVNTTGIFTMTLAALMTMGAVFTL